MNILWYILGWYGTGLAAFALLNYIGYRNGDDWTLREFFQELFMSILGPVVMIIIMWEILSGLFLKIDFNKVIIKGRKK